MPAPPLGLRAMPIRIGLVGYGYAGRTFHAPLAAGVPGLALTVVASRDAARVHADWPGVEVVATPEALVAHPAVDLVVVATPNATHHPIARAALSAGRHVVVDKPFTLTLAQALELAQLARAQGRVLSVFHNRRWDGDFLTLRGLLGAGTLGRVVQFESRFDRYRPQVRERWRESAEPGAGLWYDLGPHLVDQAVQLFGWPQAISLDLALLRDGAQSDDWCRAELHYERLRVTLHASMLAAASSLRYAVHGTLGSFIKHGLDPQEEALKAGARPSWPPAPGWGADDGAATLTLARGDALVATPCPLRPGDHGAFYAALRDAIALGAPNPVPADEACAVMALIERGLASARQRATLETQPWSG
jgi:predicted dehydrogenase